MSSKTSPVSALAEGKKVGGGQEFSFNGSSGIFYFCLYKNQRCSSAKASGLLGVPTPSSSMCFKSLNTLFKCQKWPLCLVQLFHNHISWTIALTNQSNVWKSTHLFQYVASNLPNKPQVNFYVSLYLSGCDYNLKISSQELCCDSQSRLSKNFYVTPKIRVAEKISSNF